MAEFRLLGLSSLRLRLSRQSQDYSRWLLELVEWMDYQLTEPILDGALVTRKSSGHIRGWLGQVGFVSSVG